MGFEGNADHLTIAIPWPVRVVGVFIVEIGLI